jgi:TusA-related sulfurtransferase
MELDIPRLRTWMLSRGADQGLLVLKKVWDSLPSDLQSSFCTNFCLDSEFDLWEHRAGILDLAETFFEKPIHGDFRDLRGVPCPNNFAKARVAMHHSPPHSVLTFWLDSGAPIENVPRGLTALGYEIRNRERSVEGFWVLEVFKPA